MWLSLSLKASEDVTGSLERPRRLSHPHEGRHRGACPREPRFGLGAEAGGTDVVGTGGGAVLRGHGYRQSGPRYCETTAGGAALHSTVVDADGGSAVRGRRGEGNRRRPGRECTSTGSLLRTTHTVGPIRVCCSDQPASSIAAAKLPGASCQRYRNILPGGTLMSHIAWSSGEAFLPHKNVTAHAGAFALSQNRVTFIFVGAPPPTGRRPSPGAANIPVPSHWCPRPAPPYLP